MSYLLGRYFSDPDLTSPPDLSPNYEYALLYDSSLWSWNGSAWVLETFPLYATFNDYFTNTLFILQNDVHYQMTFCGSYYSNITVVNMNGNRVISFQQNTNIIIIPPSVQYVMVRIGTTTTVYFYSPDATIPGWYILPTNRFIFSDNISKQRFLVQDSLSVFETTDCRLLNDAINDRLICCGLTDLSEPGALFDSNVNFNPQLYNAPFGITILNEQPPVDERSKFTVYSSVGIPTTAIFYDISDNLWKVDTSQIVVSTCSFTLVGCDETGHINEVYYLSPVTGVVSSSLSISLFYTTDVPPSGFINIPIFGSYTGPEFIDSPANYISLPFTVVGPNFVVDVSSLNTNPNGYFNFYTIVAGTTYLVSYLVIKKDSNFTGDLIVGGAASATKFQVQDPTTAPILNVNSATRTTTSYGDLILEGANSTTKFEIRNALNNNIFIVNTVSGTSTLNGRMTINSTTSPQLNVLNTTGNASMLFNSNGVSGTMTLLNPSGNYQFDNSIIPSVDNTYSLGSASRRWLNGYFDNVVVVNPTTFNGITNAGFYTQTAPGLNTFIDDIVLTARFRQSGPNNTSKMHVDDNLGNRVFNVDTTNRAVGIKNSLTIDGESSTSDVLNLLSNNTSTNITMTSNSLSGIFSLDFNGGFQVFKINRSLEPSVGASLDLGESAARWNTVYGLYANLTNTLTVNGINNGGYYTQTGPGINSFADLSTFVEITNAGSYTQTAGTVGFNTFIEQTNFSGDVFIIGTDTVSKFGVYNSTTQPVLLVDTTSNTINMYNNVFIDGDTNATPLFINNVLNNNTILLGCSAGSGNLTIRDFTGTLRFTVNRAWCPATTGTIDLGASTLRWNTLFTTNLDTSGSITVAGITNNGTYTQTGTGTNNLTGPLIITSGTTGSLLTLRTTVSPLNPTLTFNTTYGTPRTASITLGNGTGFLFCDTTYAPLTTNLYDLGTTLLGWKDLYLTGNVNAARMFLTTTGITTSIETNVVSNGAIVNSLLLRNNGTGATTGVGIRFEGGGGASTNATIQFNGSSILYNSSGSGTHQFNTGLSAPSYIATGTSAGATVVRMSLINNGVAANTGVSLLFNGHNGTSVTASNISQVGNNMSINNTTTDGNLTLSVLGNGTMNFSSVNGNFIFNNIVRPAVTGTTNLGTSTFRWNTVFAVAVDTSSDRRIKNTIEDETLGLQFINQLKPVKYRFNHDSESIHHGLIAQDVKQLIDEQKVDDGKFGGISIDENDNHSLRYMEFIGPLIKSVQELTTLVNKQNEVIIQLQARITDLESR